MNKFRGQARTLTKRHEHSREWIQPMNQSIVVHVSERGHTSTKRNGSSEQTKRHEHLIE
jgi:hypothetical protein